MTSHHLVWVGIVVTGFVLGFVASHLYHRKRMRKEIRDKYVLLSAAQGRIECLERTLRYRTDNQTTMQTGLENHLQLGLILPPKEGWQDAQAPLP